MGIIITAQKFETKCGYRVKISSTVMIIVTVGLTIKTEYRLPHQTESCLLVRQECQLLKQ